MTRPREASPHHYLGRSTIRPGYYIEALTNWLSGLSAHVTDKGNLETSYAYDERNQLNTVNSTAYSFLYDAFGRRESFDDLGVVETYLYDALQAVQTSNPAQNFFTGPDGEVLAYSNSSGTFVPLTDVLRSTIDLVNSSGSIATKWTYEPFGMPTRSGNSSNYPFLFAGMEYDPTGLYHNYARYYSPRLQRFTQEDPLEFGGGDINLFRYVTDDPVNATESSRFTGGRTRCPRGGGNWIPSRGPYCCYGQPGGLPGPSEDQSSTGTQSCPGSVAHGFTIGGLVGPLGGLAASAGQGSAGPAGSGVRAAGVNSGQIVLTQADDDDEDPVRNALEPPCEAASQ